MTIARTLALPLLASLAALSLAGCKAETGKHEPAAKSAVQAKPGVTVKDARLVLPGAAGNPGAAYFVVDNQGNETASITAVAIQGAGKAEVHMTQGSAMNAVARVDVGAKTHMDFEPGKLHVMVFDLAGSLKAGGSTDLTITFSDGAKITVPAKIESAGAAAMGGMEMGHAN